MTNNQKAKSVLEFIADNPGASIREIMRGCKLKSTSHTRYYIKLLTSRGFISYRPGLCRTIVANANFINSKGERWFIIALPKRRCKCGNEDLINGIEPPYCPNCKRRLISV